MEKEIDEKLEKIFKRNAFAREWRYKLLLIALKK